MNIYTASDPLFVKVPQFIIDPRQGLIRKYPLSELTLRIYLPQSLMDTLTQEGKGKIENSPAYQKIRDAVIAKFSDHFRPQFYGPFRSPLSSHIELVPAPDDLTILKVRWEKYREKLRNEGLL